MKITPEKKQELRKKWNKLTEGATKCISFSPVSVLGKKYCGICGNNPEEVADYWLNVLEEETENQKKGIVERIESNNSGYYANGTIPLSESEKIHQKTLGFYDGLNKAIEIIHNQ